jgi:hypothetical protein
LEIWLCIGLQSADAYIEKIAQIISAVEITVSKSSIIINGCS